MFVLILDLLDPLCQSQFLMSVFSDIFPQKKCTILIKTNSNEKNNMPSEKMSPRCVWVGEKNLHQTKRARCDFYCGARA